MEVTTELMDEIRRGLESIKYGKVTISIDANSRSADVSVEKRTRFEIPKPRPTFIDGIEKK